MLRQLLGTSVYSDEALLLVVLETALSDPALPA